MLFNRARGLSLFHLFEGGSVNRTMAAGDCALSLVEVNPNRTPNAGFPSDLLDLCSEAMDQALGIEKASLSAMVEINSCALDTCEHLAGDLFGAAVRVFASCVHAQLSWLTLMLPYGCAESKVLLNVAAPAGVPSIDQGMDVVIGAGGGDSWADMALSSAGRTAGQAQPAEALELCMDLVIGETAA
jgi:hypothetical protein